MQICQELRQRSRDHELSRPAEVGRQWHWNQQSLRLGHSNAHTATMPPMNPFPLLRSLPVRSRPAQVLRAGIKRPAVYRSYADDAANKHNVLPEAQDGNKVGPNMNQQEHVSEEAAKMQKIMGQEGPDIEGQGTPVQEVCCQTQMDG